MNEFLSIEDTSIDRSPPKEEQQDWRTELITPEIIARNDAETGEDTLLGALYGLITDRDDDKLDYSGDQILESCIKFPSIREKTLNYLFWDPEFTDKERQEAHKLHDFYELKIKAAEEKDQKLAA